MVNSDQSASQAVVEYREKKTFLHLQGLFFSGGFARFPQDCSFGVMFRFDPKSYATRYSNYYEVDCTTKLDRFRNRSDGPTRIAVGSSRMRIAGSSPLVARTAMQPPSSNGSETISKRSPYILMCLENVKPRSRIFAQLSELLRTLFHHSFRCRAAPVCSPARRTVYSPTAFSTFPIHS